MPGLLLVDDNPEYARLLAGFLSDKGYQCSTCASAGEALRALEHGRFDAVAVDLILTDSPGLTVVLACRSRRIPVVLLTPLDEADTLSRRLCPAGTPVVTKIARFDVIEQAISHAIMEKRLYQAAKPTDT